MINVYINTMHTSIQNFGVNKKSFMFKKALFLFIYLF